MEGRKYLAEAVGMFAIVLAAVGALSVGNGVASVGLAVAVGFTVYAMLSAVPDTDLNPAVTVARWVAKRTDTVGGLITIISQLVGAVIAAYLARAIYGDATSTIATGMTVLSGSTTTQIAVLVEAVLTGLLVWTWLGSRNAAPVAFVYAVGILVAGTLTGGALNPARSFGPAFAEGNWVNQWVYWVGPIIGAIVAAVVYEYGIGMMKEETISRRTK